MPDKTVRKYYPVPERWRMLMDGRLDVEDLDDEELRRGQLRDKLGHFKGHPPKLVPREIITAMQREGYKRHAEWVQDAVTEAQKVIMELMKNKHPLPGDATRLKAAEAVLERYAGKVPEKIEMNVTESRFEKSMAGAEIIMDIEEEDDDFSK